MKKNVIILLLLTPVFVFGQIKGDKSKDPYTTTKGTKFEKKDVIQLATASKDAKFAYAYTFKSNMSFGNLVKTAKNVKDVSNLNVKNTKGIKNAIETAENISDDDLLKSSVESLQNRVVSEKYVSENALASSSTGEKYKIKYFKIYTDDESGKQVVHAIAKGKKGKIAVLLDAAEAAGEISTK